jgi:WD40 repeat protein
VVGHNGMLYVALYDGTIQVRSTENGELLRTLCGHTGPVFSIAVGLDGQVYSGSTDMSICVCSLTTFCL